MLYIFKCQLVTNKSANTNYTHRIEMCEKYMGMNIRAVRVSKKQKTIFDM